jgi:diguanylate cyclase (GGDEF)-like protein/PAS domain S-box-containing protein
VDGEGSRLELGRERDELVALLGRERAWVTGQLGQPAAVGGRQRAEVSAGQQRHLNDRDDLEEREATEGLEHLASSLPALKPNRSAPMKWTVIPSVELLPEAALVLAPHGAVLASSPPAAAMFRREPVELTAIVADPSRLWDAVAGLPVGAQVPVVPLVGLRANGVPFALDASVRVLGDGALLCVLRELDRQGASALEAAFDHMPIGMALFNTDGEFLRVNGALCALLGRSDAELIGMRDNALTHPDDRQNDIDAAWRILRGELSSWQCEKRFVRPDGSVVWALANLTFLRDAHGRPLCWVGQFQDITELRRMASRDPLTDALNRRAFGVELARCRSGALLVIDLDGFKDINDAHGHQAGDELLRVVAGAISRRIRRGDVLARLGGDEFAVLLPRCEVEEAARVAADLADLVVSQRFVFDGVERSVTASIGLARVNGESPEALLSAADRAMYSAKAVGGGRVRGYTVL